MDAALNLATVTSHPSVTCVQLTHDGQILLATKSAIYILTTDLGVNVDELSTFGSNPSVVDPSKSIRWFRTMIEIDKSLTHNWPLDSQEWGALSLGSIDISLRSVTCSPSHLTTNSGSIIVTLDTNMQLSLWTSLKHHLRGEWIKLLDVTQFLKDNFDYDEASSPTVRTMGLQVTAIAWSLQTKFGLTPAPCIDGSLLAVATRANSIHFLRYKETEESRGGLDIVASLVVGDRWTNHCAWSPWSCPTSGLCLSWLACGLTDGSVRIVEVVQKVVPAENPTGFGPEFTVDATFKEAESISVDKRGLTGLRWISVPDKMPLLVFCKPGTVHLFRFMSPTLAWSGHKTVLLQIQKTSVDSSSLHPASGIAYNIQRDALFISLLDGSFHVIENICTDPKYVSNDEAQLTSKKLSVSSRSLFLKAEGGELSKSDANRISGMVLMEDGCTFCWLHESCRPTDFSYKHEAKHNTMFIVTEMIDTIADDQYLPMVLQEAVKHWSKASGHAPISHLLPLFMQLRKAGRLNRILPQLLNILKSDVPEDALILESTLQAWSGDITPEMRTLFRRQLKSHLFGWDSLLNLRLRLAIADFCWASTFLSSPNQELNFLQKHLKDDQLQEQCGAVAQKLLIDISCGVLRILLRFLTAVLSVLKPEDIPFAYRIIIQSSLPGHPADLTAQANELAAAIQKSVLPAESSAADEAGKTEESCPACSGPIPLQDINNGVCQKNHFWTRCSITSFILATPKVRTCLGCTRKAFLPNSIESLPQAARSWVVEELLRAAQRCLFCGNRFVTII